MQSSTFTVDLDCCVQLQSESAPSQEKPEIVVNELKLISFSHQLTLVSPPAGKHIRASIT